MELLETRACLNYGMWRTLSILLDYDELTAEVTWNIQISSDCVILPNNLNQGENQ